MKKEILMAFCAAAVLTGCQQAEEIGELSGKLPMSVEAGIVKTMGSRYVVTDNDPNNLTFGDGNKIGISVAGRKFEEWTLTGTTWAATSGTVYWNDKASLHKFCAFYPFADVTEGGDISMPSLSDQNGTMESISTRDFLVATKEQSYDNGDANGVVSFTGNNAFKHVSSLLQFTLKGEGDLLNATIKSMELSGDDIISSSTYNFSKAEAERVKVATDETGDGISITPTDCAIDAGGKIFYFIVNAGTVSLDGMSLTIKYKSGDKDYTATLAKLGGSDQKLGSGLFYKYGLKVADGVLAISGNTISGWGNGENMGNIVINGSEDSNNQGGDDNEENS